MRLIHLKLAARNVRRQPHRTIALGGAVAFSALIMTLISGFVNGMDSAIQDNVTLYSGGHVLVSGYTASWSGRLQNRFANDEIAKIIEKAAPDIWTVSPVDQARATVVFGTHEIELTLRGINWESDQLYHNALIVLHGDWNGIKASRSMLMSAQTANRFGLSIGDQVVVRLTTSSGQENVTDYKVAGIYDDSAAGGMNTAFVSFADLTTDLNMKQNEQQQIAVFLRNSINAENVARNISKSLAQQGYTVNRDGSKTSAVQVNRQLLPGTTLYRIATVQELAGEIGDALGSIRWIGYAVFFLMLIVSATGISNSYRMVLLERTKEIGMLRCIGYKRKDVFLSFISEGILLAGGAALIGVIFAMPIGFGIGSVSFNPHGDFGAALVQGHLQFAPLLSQLVLIVIFVTTVAIGAVFFPARKAAEIMPVEALRKTA